MDPHCKDALASKEALEYWSPVDWYNGGMEHTTLHLLYSRFWHKFLYDNGGATKAEFETLVQLLNPFAPHMTEELWEKLGHSHDEQLAYYPWPAYEEAKCVEAAVEIAVQVNGKVKARLKVPADITAEDAIATAKADPAVAAALEGKQLVKEIYVKGRLVNLAAKG